MQRQTYQICNLEYDNELNVRMNERYFPSSRLQPNFNPRPTSTKYVKYPVNSDIFSQNGLHSYKRYNPTQVFYPGTSKAPVEFALDNVDVESNLRNQFMALQKNDQAKYIPSSHSSLYSLMQYKTKITDYNTNQQKMHEISNIHFNPDRCNLAPDTFNNSTRVNLKNMK